MNRLLESLSTTGPLADLFADQALVAAMLRFEAALARVEARLGLIAPTVPAAIDRAATPEVFDVAAIAHQSRQSGTVAIPFIDALRARVHAVDAEAATFVHWGATSQDVTDTALILCVARARAILDADHARLRAAVRRLSDAHAGTVMLARTLMQPAGPTTFGLKAAGWFAALSRGQRRLSLAFDDACVLQFGGASGTLAALGESGIDVSSELARELELPLPDAPWHTHRDRLASLVTACGIYTGTLGKIARDISLLMQFEVGEAAEPGGGSSSMPHKHNPVGCAIVLAAATRVPHLVASFLGGMAQELERGLGGWHAEAITVASVVQSTGSAVAAMADVIESLKVDPERMRQNLAATGSFLAAEQAMLLLALALGRDSAGTVVADAMQAALTQDISLADALAADPRATAVLNRSARASLGDPAQYLGAAERFRQRLLDTDSD